MTQTITVTTTPSVEGHVILRYLDVVHTEIVLSINILKDIMADVRDVFGGRVKVFEEKFQEASQTAISELKSKAAELGANAIVGLELSWSIPGGSRTGFLVVCGCGTAVFVVPQHERRSAE